MIFFWKYKKKSKILVLIGVCPQLSIEIRLTYVYPACVKRWWQAFFFGFGSPDALSPT